MRRRCRVTTAHRGTVVLTLRVDEHVSLTDRRLVDLAGKREWRR
jgi:hypothetical protein